MGEYSRYTLKRPRTIDRLEISDCIEIIINDLERYGVPQELIVDLLTYFFNPLRAKSDELKKEYADKWFKNTPNSAFER